MLLVFLNCYAWTSLTKVLYVRGEVRVVFHTLGNEPINRVYFVQWCAVIGWDGCCNEQLTVNQTVLMSLWLVEMHVWLRHHYIISLEAILLVYHDVMWVAIGRWSARRSRKFRSTESKHLLSWRGAEWSTFCGCSEWQAGCVQELFSSPNTRLAISEVEESSL